MTQPSGWYDDPQDSTQLRYWDGVVWSNHVTPKVSPTIEQSTIGMPYGVTPVAARGQSPGSSVPPGATREQRGYDPAGGQGTGSGQWPAYGQGPGSLGGQVGWQAPSKTTPDGVRLSGWWLRVLARLMDGVFTFVLALPLTGWFYYQYLAGVIDWSKTVAAQPTSGSTPLFTLPPADIYEYAFAASVIGLLVAGVYEVFFLSRTGATPGKRIVGISVRLRDRPGPLTMSTALGRTACYFGLSLLSVANLLDVLWPLWDDKNQAIHDKVVSTNVVMGPQARRHP